MVSGECTTSDSLNSLSLVGGGGGGGGGAWVTDHDL